MRSVYGDDGAVWCDLGSIQKETQAAYLLQLAEEEKPRWVPKSCVIDIGEEVVGIAKWFAQKNGIQGDW